MARIRLTVNTPPGSPVSSFEYVNQDSYDLDSDPMVVVVTSIGYDNNGDPSEETHSREFSKSEYTGEVIEESV